MTSEIEFDKAKMLYFTEAQICFVLFLKYGMCQCFYVYDYVLLFSFSCISGNI